MVCVMSTAPVALSSEYLLRVNLELRKLVRILKDQNRVLLQQNRTYEELHKFDSKTLRELSSGKPRKRRTRELN